MPNDWGFGKSESGWMTGETFFEYISNVFYPWLVKNNIKLPVLLFVDGHVSHLTLHLSKFCSDNGIILVALHPNATHILQPMDVAVFHPLKVKWRKAVQQWRCNNRNARFRREHFAPLLKEVIDSAINPTILANGFKKCGLFPFTPDGINFSSIIKGNSATNIESNKPLTNNEPEKSVVEINCFLNFFEDMVGPEKIQIFRSTASNWEGEIEDLSLFNLWKKISDINSAQICFEDDKEIVSNKFKKIYLYVVKHFI